MNDETNELVAKSLGAVLTEVKKLTPAGQHSLAIMERTIKTAMFQNLDLLSGDKEEFLRACVKAGQLGMLPDGREAVIIKMKGTPTFFPMVYGIKKRIYEAGVAASITEDIYREGDTFRRWNDDAGMHLLHKIRPECDGKTIGAYCQMITKDGIRFIEYMGKPELDKARNASFAKNGPWASWYEEMCKKTVMKRMAKRIPMPHEISEIFAYENSLEARSDRQGRKPRKVRPEDVFGETAALPPKKKGEKNEKI